MTKSKSTTDVYIQQLFFFFLFILYFIYLSFTTWKLIFKLPEKMTAARRGSGDISRTFSSLHTITSMVYFHMQYNIDRVTACQCVAASSG